MDTGSSFTKVALLPVLFISSKKNLFALFRQFSIQEYIILFGKGIKYTVLTHPENTSKNRMEGIF